MFLTFVQLVPDESWRKDEKGMRRYFHRALGDKLIEWIADNGPAIVSGIEEISVLSSTMKGMTEVRLRMILTPIGPLLDHKFYFRDGPVDGEQIQTDGSAYWRVPITGAPMRMADYIADGPPAAASKGPLVAVYVRRDGYYRFEGYER